MRAMKCIIWDEIVPQHRYAIETLDRTLRDLRDKDEPFGGTTDYIILCLRLLYLHLDIYINDCRVLN